MQSAHKPVLESRHKSHTVVNAVVNGVPSPVRPPIEQRMDEDTDTESEPESEVIELGPGDSVSQQPAIVLDPPPPPDTNLYAPLSPDRPDTPDELEMDVDTPVIEESDESDSDLVSNTVHANKRPRLAKPSRNRRGWSQSPHRSASASRNRMPRSSTQPNLSQPALSTAPVETLPLNVNSLLACITRLVQQATPSPPSGDHGALLIPMNASQSDIGYDSLVKVLENIAPREDASTHGSATFRTRTAVPSPPHPAHTDLLEDNVEAFEAETGCSLAKDACTRRKPTLSDFPGLPRRIASLAIPEFVAEACVQGPYETFGTLCDLAAEVYERVWHREAPKVPFQAPPHELVVLIVHRLSWFRGELKVRIREKIVFMFGFITPPRTRADLRSNRKLVKKLNSNTFHCRDLQTDINQYEHPAVELCIAAGFFWGPDSPGMVYYKQFRRIPLPAVSTVLTTMQHCISEWKTGRFVTTDLNAAKQLKVYESHLKGLLEYAKPAPKRLRRFRQLWHQFAVDYAGSPAEDDSEPLYQPTTRADRVRPDTPSPDPDMEERQDGTTGGQGEDCVTD